MTKLIFDNDFTSLALCLINFMLKPMKGVTKKDFISRIKETLQWSLGGL
jgi:hypothetical protein